MRRSHFTPCWNLVLVCAAVLSLPQGTRAEDRDPVKRFLGGLLYSRQEVNDWLTQKAFPFCKYDPGLGYLHRNRRIKEGIHGSYCTYTYDQWDARVMLNNADQSCRINTYGDSFTSCEQVNDGETWQEQLAANLGEPVRNYGIGGYSVYLSYLRMKREEAKKPAEYIIFNIFDDDHYRNLISWQRITSRKGTHSFHPPLPYVVANPATGEFVEKPNPCPTPESLFQLCDIGWVHERFKDDFVLLVRLAQTQTGDSLEVSGSELIRELASRHGINPQVNYSGDDLAKTANTMYTQAALFSSMRIVEKVEEFAKIHGKKVLYVLSYGPNNVTNALEGGARFDGQFVDFLEKKGLPYVDLLQRHVSDYSRFKPGVREYLNRYFIGHYSAAGNAFYAAAVADSLLEMLQPAAPAYREP